MKNKKDFSNLQLLSGRSRSVQEGLQGPRGAINLLHWRCRHLGCVTLLAKAALGAR
jgi:hypothetical protein